MDECDSAVQLNVCLFCPKGRSPTVDIQIEQCSRHSRILAVC